jgi:conjugative transfer signal peptidase TraF
MVVRARGRSWTRGLALIAIGLFLAVFGLFLAGARINCTRSLARGLYWTRPGPPRRGDRVLFWPRDTPPFRLARERGYIPPGPYNRTDGPGYGLMLKKLLALPGDVVSIDEDGVSVNYLRLAHSRPLPRDNLGAPLPSARLKNYRLREGEALFLSDEYPRSYDSRYFGVQELGQIVEVVEPVWTW